MPSESYPIPAPLTRWQKLALPIGVVGIIIGLIALFFSPRVFFNAWFFAWWFWMGVSLGGLAITMMHHLTGGNWGLAVRRPCEAAASVMPLMFILFLPLMLGIYYLFPWGNQSWWSTDPVLVHQHIYFNPRWFFIRNLIYFACWCGLTWKLVSEAASFEKTIDFGMVRKMRNLSAGGIVLFFVTVTMAAFDWLMSREVHFYSSVLGFIVCVGMSMSGLALVIALLPILQKDEQVGPLLKQQTMVDLGNLLMTHVILWAYMSFAQLLIVWMGNVKVETGWYVHRGIGENANGWRWVGLFLALCGFLIPFLMLLQRRRVKRYLPLLAGTAAGILIVRAVDVLWLSAPSTPSTMSTSHYSGTGQVVWLAVPLFFGIGGLWWWTFVFMLRRRSLVPPIEDSPEQAANNPIMGSQTGDQESAPGIN